MKTLEPTDHHRRLATFVGTWRGEERMHPSRWRPDGGVGFFLISNYAQRQGGVQTHAGHGVYGYDGHRTLGRRRAMIRSPRWMTCS